MSASDDAKPATGRDAPWPTPAAAHSMPLYEVVKRQITEAILSGRWPAGTVLPSEIALGEQFGVATGTVRRALLDLTNDGLLSRRRKTGTVVTGRTPQHSLALLMKYFRLHRADGALTTAESRPLSVQVASPTPTEAEALHLGEADKVLRIDRVRYADGKPVMHDRFVMDAARFPGLSRPAEDLPHLLYAHIAETYGVRISAVREQLSAQLADETIARALELPPNAPVLVIEEMAYDQTNTPTILATHHADTTSHRYVNEVQ